MKKSKIIASIVAAAICGSSLLGGTVAWQSISQETVNEVRKSVNPGGRLHDDFNGENKDVYVENFGDEPIFARIKLKEYFEIGVDAGDFAASDRNVEIITKDPKTGKDASQKDTGTWPVHRYNEIDEGNETHVYWEWDMGGSTVYLPTFNMNKDSVEPDINGSAQDEDGPYTGYKEYEPGVKVPGDEIKDADINNVDEGEKGKEGENYTSTSHDHITAETKNATVMSMQEWIDAGSQPGEYWVYDTDGWAYYATPIAKKTASGLLLNGIELKNEPDSYYYAIHVIAEFVTADDVGTEGDDEGFYASKGEAPSADALKLLWSIGAITDASIEKYSELNEIVEEEINAQSEPAFDPAADMADSAAVEVKATQPEAQGENSAATDEAVEEHTSAEGSQAESDKQDSS